MGICEDCPDYEELYRMADKEKKPMKKPETGGTPKKITTKNKPGSTGPGGANSVRDRQTTDSNNP
jgi:hypothetical protein